MEEEVFDTYVDPCHECIKCKGLGPLVHGNNLRELMDRFNHIQWCIARCERCILQEGGDSDIDRIVKNLRISQEQIGKKKGEKRGWFDDF